MDVAGLLVVEAEAKVSVIGEQRQHGSNSKIASESRGRPLLLPPRHSTCDCR